ncbi:MAG: metallophosphoesterase [Anaerolineae bacterium]|nr:metallophosphoesterase [Anaerolineae bacterium]CAG0956741.1 Alkaline phosphatase [Anaerolineae bacterium]
MRLHFFRRALGLALIGMLLVNLMAASHSVYAQDAVILAAGDIAACIYTGDDQTAALLDKLDGLILALGDTVQTKGAMEEYLNCFEPTWGRHKGRIRPIPGNHDYQGDGGKAYFEYFGEAAGEAGKGWYSFNYGAWHLIALNSMVPANSRSEQVAWLKADLAANPTPCTLVYFHHPVFSSGAGGLTSRMNTVLRVLYDAGVELVLSGDAHHYERFTPMTPDKLIDREKGVRQFVVGTGGGYLTRLGNKWRATEARTNETHGILRLVLSAGSYSWEFVKVEASTSDFEDSGSAPCH